MNLSPPYNFMKFKKLVKDKLGINLDKRLSNPQFIGMLVVAVLSPILAYMGLNMSDLSSWNALGNILIQAISNPYLLALVAVNVYNATIDPTTNGAKDSQLVLDGESSDDIRKEVEELNEILDIRENKIKKLMIQIEEDNKNGEE